MNPDMVEPNANPHVVLREEILGDAARQGERILRRARKEAEILLANARDEAEQDRREVEAHTEKEAAHRRDMILATVAIESARVRAARVETLLRSMYDEAARRLTEQDGSAYRDTLVRLAGEAIRRMDGDAFVVEVAGQDLAVFGDGLADDVGNASGRLSLDVTLNPRADAHPGTLIIRDPEGRQVWDNGLITRLQRSWPVLRSAVALRVGLVEKKSADGGFA